MSRNRRGGGVAFYVREGISNNRIKEVTSDEMQILTILCENSVEKTFVTIVYKLRQMNKCDFFDQLQAYLLEFKCNLVICTLYKEPLYLENSLLLFGLILLKNESTRKTKSSQPTINIFFYRFLFDSHGPSKLYIGSRGGKNWRQNFAWKT